MPRSGSRTSARRSSTGGSRLPAEVSHRIPLATYRLQLARSFGFREAHELVPYLQELGITDSYFSPFLDVSSNASHGYDIANHNRFNPALGSEEDYQALTAALHARGMGQLLDVVPNHMGISGSRKPSWYAWHER
jgi:maltooligosyltrehalose synthase